MFLFERLAGLLEPIGNTHDPGVDAFQTLCFRLAPEGNPAYEAGFLTVEKFSKDNILEKEKRKPG